MITYEVDFGTHKLVIKVETNELGRGNNPTRQCQLVKKEKPSRNEAYYEAEEVMEFTARNNDLLSMTNDLRKLL